MTSTILVTGGAGFIGSHLVRLLVERGEHVRVLDLPGALVSHLPLDRLELVSGDICDEATVQRVVRGLPRGLSSRRQPAPVGSSRAASSGESTTSERSR